MATSPQRASAATSAARAGWPSPGGSARAVFIISERKPGSSMFRRLAALAKTGVPRVPAISSANAAKTASSGSDWPSHWRSSSLVAGKAVTSSGLSTLRFRSAAIGQTKVNSRKTTSGRISAPYLSFFIRSARRSRVFSEMGLSPAAWVRVAVSWVMARSSAELLRGMAGGWWIGEGC